MTGERKESRTEKDEKKNKIPHDSSVHSLFHESLVEAAALWIKCVGVCMGIRWHALLRK